MDNKDNYTDAEIVADFEFVQNEPIEVTFEINPSGQDAHYIHYQDVPSDTWNITHTMNKYPSVTIVTSGGDKVYSDIEYISVSQIQIKFRSPFTGRVYLN